MNENGKSRRKINVNNVILAVTALNCVGLIVFSLVIIPSCSDTRDTEPPRRLKRAWRSGQYPLDGAFPGTIPDADGYLRTEVVVVDKFTPRSLEAAADLGGGKTLSTFCRDGDFPPGIKGGDRLLIRGRIVEDRSGGANTNIVLEDVMVLQILER